MEETKCMNPDALHYRFRTQMGVKVEPFKKSSCMQEVRDERTNVSDSVDSIVEVEKLKLEMKMLETALQGAVRQAQAIVNEGMSQRAVHQAMFESIALMGANLLQIYLLQLLFERKFGIFRV
ncbi:transmembrane emp24 domain-containing protein p24beta2-like [Vitis riparia]|uniref:transmembrane emp24 domain-containing protein p24beta2-like n=1 Tax=Vitis riparia TaxID=96939 RepID=UPI00155B205A|nr:transmembrane emp24 domain-containing protein p24beta2-like [Vitis riparia]